MPTDLLGVTPGRYESARTDGSMQAATGAVSHQLRLQMKAQGPVPGRLGADTRSEAGAGEESGKTSWIHDFFREKFDSAKIALEKELEGKTGEEVLETKGWILYCELKLRKDGDTEPLLKFASDHADSSRVQSVVATVLRLEGHSQKAIQLLADAQHKKPKDPVLALALARCHSDGVDNEKAIAELLRVGPDDFPNVAIDLAEALEEDGKKPEALAIIQRCFAKNPSHRGLRYKYARIAQDLDEHEIAVHLLNGLKGEDPKSIEYWGYLGNSCMQLELYDTALHAYRRAEKLMKVDESSQWIISNIGNLLTNRGLPTEACEYLERAIKYESRSEYAHV